MKSRMYKNIHFQGTGMEKVQKRTTQIIIIILFLYWIAAEAPTTNKNKNKKKPNISIQIHTLEWMLMLLRVVAYDAVAFLCFNENVVTNEWDDFKCVCVKKKEI